MLEKREMALECGVALSLGSSGATDKKGEKMHDGFLVLTSVCVF